MVDLSTRPAVPPERPIEAIEDAVCICSHNHFSHEGLTGGMCLVSGCPCLIFTEREV